MLSIPSLSNIEVTCDFIRALHIHFLFFNSSSEIVIKEQTHSIESGWFVRFFSDSGGGFQSAHVVLWPLSRFTPHSEAWSVTAFSISLSSVECMNESLREGGSFICFIFISLNSAFSFCCIMLTPSLLIMCTNCCPYHCLTYLEFPQIILDIEKVELDIACGLQDRVVQTYGGLVHMDFTAAEHVYTEVDTSLLFPMYLAYNMHAGEGRVVNMIS